MLAHRLDHLDPHRYGIECGVQCGIDYDATADPTPDMYNIFEVQTCLVSVSDSHSL